MTLLKLHVLSVIVRFSIFKNSSPGHCGRVVWWLSLWLNWHAGGWWFDARPQTKDIKMLGSAALLSAHHIKQGSK